MSANQEKNFPVNSVISIYTASALIQRPQDEEPSLRAVWVSVVCGSGEVVYETFIRQSHDSIIDDKSFYHGLSWDRIKFGTSELTAQRQIVDYIATARTVVSDDPEMHLQHLGFSPEQIIIMRPKLVDLCRYYSPYTNLKPFNFRFIAYLILKGKINFPDIHPPTYSAKLALNLYFISRPLIDLPPYQWTGNTWIAKLFALMLQASLNFPLNLLNSCQYTDTEEYPQWNNGHGYVDPDQWQDHHPSAYADPEMQVPIRLPRNPNRDDLDEWFRPVREYSPVDWNAGQENPQEQRNPSQESPQEQIPPMIPLQANEDAVSHHSDDQVVPASQQLIIPLSALRALSPNSRNELYSIIPSQDLRLTEEQNALLIDEHLNDATEEVAFTAASSLFNETVAPVVQEAPAPDPELDSAIRAIAEDNAQITSPPQAMDTCDPYESPSFSPLTPTRSSESTRRTLPQATVGPQPTTSADISSQDLPNRLFSTTLSSQNSSNPSTQESPGQPLRSSSRSSQPQATHSQPPSRRSSSRALSPQGSVERPPSSGSGTSLLQATRIRTNPKVIAPKPKKKKSSKDKDKP